MRCYNGAWDSEATALFAKQDALTAELLKLESQAHCTYFPYEEQFQIHVWGKPISDFSKSRIDALQQAIMRLKS